MSEQEIFQKLRSEGDGEASSEGMLCAPLVESRGIKLRRETTSVLPDLDELVRNRALRLGNGQADLADSIIRETLAHRALFEPQALEDRLNGTVSDLKSYLQLLATRLGDDHPVSHLLTDLRHFASAGEWYQPDQWFATTDTMQFGGSWQLCREKGIPPLRAALSETFGSVRTPGALVEEYQLNELCPLMRERLAEICQSRAADMSRDEPQEGIPWWVTPEEIRHMLSQDSTILFTLKAGGEIVGLFVLYTDFAPLSDGGRAICNDWCEGNHVSPERVCYGELVGISHAGSALFSQNGESAYRLLFNSVKETAHLLGFSHILGEVWTKNLVMPKHLAVGWEQTGAVRPYKDFELELVSIQITPHSDVVAWDNEALFPVLGDPAHIQDHYRNCERRICDAPAAFDRTRDFLREGGDISRYCTVRMDNETLSGNKSGISIWVGAGQYYFAQNRRGMDEWRYCWGKEIFTFEECLKQFREDFFRRPY